MSIGGLFLRLYLLAPWSNSANARNDVPELHLAKSSSTRLRRTIVSGVRKYVTTIGTMLKMLHKRGVVEKRHKRNTFGPNVVYLFLHKKSKR